MEKSAKMKSNLGIQGGSWHSKNKLGLPYLCVNTRHRSKHWLNYNTLYGQLYVMYSTSDYILKILKQPVGMGLYSFMRDIKRFITADFV